MLDGDGANKKSNSKLGQAPLEKGTSSSKLKGLNRDKSNKDLEDSWGSLQYQAEQMLGPAIEDETAPQPKLLKDAANALNVSISTTQAAAQHKIEEEIIAEEIKLA